MTVNYTPLLGLAQPVTGTESGTWGDTINASLTALVESSIAGVATASVAAADWTLSTTGSGAANEQRMAILIPTGSSGTTRNINAPKQSKLYVVINSSTGSVVLRGGPTTPTAGVTITAGSQALVAWNGTDFVNITPAVSGYLPLTGGTMTGAITFAAGQLIPASSVVRSAKSSAYTIVAGDKGSLIEVTSGTFTLSLTAAATLGSGWWCYVSNIGTGLITIDPDSTETITVNGTAMSTWVQWTTEIGILQCDGTGFNYYQMQKGYTQQTVSSAVSSVNFTSGVAGRRKLRLTLSDVDVTAGLTLKLRVNSSDFTNTSILYGISSLSNPAATFNQGFFSIPNENIDPSGGTSSKKQRASADINFDGATIIATSYGMGGYTGTTYKVNTSIGYQISSTMTSINLVTSTSTLSAGTYTLTEL